MLQYAGAGPRDVTLAVKTKKGKERGELHLTVDFKVAAFKVSMQCRCSRGGAQRLLRGC